MIWEDDPRVIQMVDSVLCSIITSVQNCCGVSCLWHLYCVCLSSLISKLGAFLPLTGSGAAYKGRPCFALYADFSEGLDLQMVISDILLLEITYAAFSPIGNLLPAVLSRIFAFLRIIYVGPEKNRHCSTVFTEMRFVIKLPPAFGAHIEPGKVTDPAFSFSPAVFHGA